MVTLPPKPPRAQRQARPLVDLEIDLTCTDCPLDLSCRTVGTLTHPYRFERFCEGGPKAWTCPCPVAERAIFGTWPGVLTGTGPGEPIGVVPAYADAWTFEVGGTSASLRAQWDGLMPCSWRLEMAGVWVGSGACDGEGVAWIDGLRAGDYVLTFDYESGVDTARIPLSLSDGQDLNLGRVPLR